MKTIIEQIEKLGWKSHTTEYRTHFYKEKGDWRVFMTVEQEDDKTFSVYIIIDDQDYQKTNIQKRDIIKTIKTLTKNARKDVLDLLSLLTNK